MTWAVYLGAAMAVHERFHIRIMAGVVVLPYRDRPGPVVTLLADLIWAAFLVFMMVYGWEYLELLWRQQTIIASMKIDAKWFQTIIVIGNGADALPPDRGLLVLGGAGRRASRRSKTKRFRRSVAGPPQGARSRRAAQGRP